MTMITNTWNKLLGFYAARHEPENMRPLAEWYWRTLLTVTLFAMVAILAYGSWGFYNVMQKLGAGQGAASAGKPRLLSEVQLEEFLAAYEARTAEFEALRSQSANVSDPSR